MSDLDDSFKRAQRLIDCMELRTRSLALKAIVIRGGALTAREQAELDQLEIKLRDCDPPS